MISKFVGTFRELASFSELLNTQVELILVERVHRNWLKVPVRLAAVASCAHIHCVPALSDLLYLRLVLMYIMRKLCANLLVDQRCLHASNIQVAVNLPCTSLQTCASLPVTDLTPHAPSLSP